MKNLNDKTYRQELTERYLDADTSIEEEKALVNFYKNCKAENLTEEELSIRNMILGLENYPQKASKGNSSIRISAILLAAAMIAGLIFLLFPIKDRFSNKSNLASLAPTSQVVRSYQTSTGDSKDNLTPAEEMERQDSLFLDATKDLVVPSPQKSILSKNKITTKQKQTKEHKNIKKGEEKEKLEVNEVQEEKDGSLSNDFNHYYEVASLALPSADQLKIDKEGDNIIITTIDMEGNSQHFTIDTSEANEGLYQLHPLAQLNE